MSSAEKPIIVIKKKGGHGGHHGGAWKIAYADFVTAMMAFFMVMWLVNSADTATKKSISSYFKRPGVFELGSGTPLEIGGAGILEDAFAPPQPEEKDVEEGVVAVARKRGYKEGPLAKGNTPPEELIGQTPGGQRIKTEGGLPFYDKKFISAQQAAMKEVAEQIKQMMKVSPEFQTLLGAVEVRVDADGLTIDIMDTKKSSMFASGSAMILPEAKAAFTKLSKIISEVPNELEIIGHTDAKPFSNRPNGYSNWELSADRANAARRLLLSEGIEPERIVSVVGKADTNLKNEEAPFDSINRRITLKMKLGINKKIDLGSDPTALDNIKDLAAITPPPTVESAPKELTASEILASTPAETMPTIAVKQVPKRKPGDPISLPPAEESIPEGMPRDKIFGEHPIISPFGLGN